MLLPMNTGIVRFWNNSRIVGAGCLINDRLVLTCAHVVAAALEKSLLELAEQPIEMLQLDFPLVARGARAIAEICFWDAAQNLAVVRVEKIPVGAGRVNFCDPSAAFEGHGFQVFGFPSGYDDGQWADGVLNQVNSKGLIQLSAVSEVGNSIKPGYNGSPVWDNELGAVVGIIMAADTESNAPAGYIIPIGKVRDCWTDFAKEHVENIPAAKVETRPGSTLVEQPSGTITFLFTDIEGSTRLWEKYPQQMAINLARHDVLLQAILTRHAGYVFKTIGDAFCVAFARAQDGIQAAIEIQQTIKQNDWGDVVIRVRIGLHTGETEQRNNDYFGQTLNRVARLASVGHGGQILLSDATTSLVRSGLPVGAELTYLGKRRLKDLLQPENIYQLSFPGLETGFAELRTVDAFPNNLPVQINSFIGRKKEIAEIKQSIMENRLITITGSGGTGKTRLSLQVAVDLLEYFQDGIWFVELSDIFDGKNIPQAIFSAMQMNEPKGMPPTQALIDCLKYKNTLLVLDNCEQVLRDCANIAAELLESVPALKIIATSREAMKVNGELSYRIPSLSIPNRESPLSSEQLAEYESVQLFVARARLVSKQFFIHAGNAWALEQICHRLDGMPFPIELAAALTRLMPVEQIAELLNEDFGILVNDSPVAMPRSQTMRASLDWSYRLLSKDEKKLLRSLSVFRGGWTLDAIGAVCAAQEKADIGLSQKLLKPLVDKSLVIFQEDKRYHMLETTRQYAGEKLKKSGKAEILKRRHAEYFLAVLRQHQTDYPRFQVEWHNILSAGEYFCAAGQMEGLAELIFLVAEPLIVSGSLSAGLDFLEKAILLARTRGEPRFLVLFLNQVGRFSFEQSEFERAGRSFDESISLNLAGSLDEHALAEAYYYQSWIHAEKEELPQAVELLEKSRQLYTRLGDDAGLADVFYLDGYMNFYGDDLLKVHVLLLSALNLFERLHSQMGKLKCLHLLSFVFVEKYKRERSLQDAIVEAEKFARAALVLSETLGELNYRASLFHLLAEITAARGNYEDSYHHALESMQLSLKFGDKKLNAQTALHLCRIFVEQKKYQQALDWGSQALQSFKNLDDARGMAHVYKQFYLAQRGLDHSQEAMLAYHESRRLYVKLNDVAQIKVLEEMRKSA